MKSVKYLFINSYLLEAKKIIEKNFANKSILKNYELCEELSTNNIIKKTCGNILGNKAKSLKSQEIEYFINQFNIIIPYTSCDKTLLTIYKFFNFIYRFVFILSLIHI